MTLSRFLIAGDRFELDGEPFRILSGALDLARFLRTVHDESMYAIVRPGPYICAEWDNGGLPAWLFTDPEVGIRRSEPRFLSSHPRLGHTEF